MTIIVFKAVMEVERIEERDWAERMAKRRLEENERIKAKNV